MEEYDIFNYPRKGSREEVFHTLGEYRHRMQLLTKYGNFSSVNYVVKCTGGEVMVSYGVVCGVKLNDGRIYFTNYHDFSQTTMGYVKQWCGYGVAERRKMIANRKARCLPVARYYFPWVQ